MNFVHTITKLKRILPDSYKELVDAYLLRYDAENIKTVLRAQHTEQHEIELERLVLPVGKLSMDALHTLMHKKSVDEVLQALPTPFRSINTGTLLEMEVALDHTAFRILLDVISRLDKHGEVFREYLTELIDATNVLIFLQLHNEGLSGAQIRQYIFSVSSAALTDKLLRARSEDGVRKIMQQSKYKIDSIDSLADVELTINKHIIKKTLLFHHQNPLSPYVILGFLFAKEMEIQNIRRLVKAKHFGVSDEQIMQYLVIR